MPPTRWDWLEQLRSCGGDSAEARRALALLCEGYWYPVYARLRSQGWSREQAEDLTQGFFFNFLRTRAFERADPSRGRLRALLITALNRHVSSVVGAERALKRGGSERIDLPIFSGTDWAEDRFLAEPQVQHPDPTPDIAFNRRWWALILEKAQRNLAADFARRNRSVVFTALWPFLEDSRPGGVTLKSTAAQIGMGETALRVALARLRRQLAEEVRQIVERTTGSAEAAEEELKEFQ